MRLVTCTPTTTSTSISHPTSSNDVRVRGFPQPLPDTNPSRSKESLRFQRWKTIRDREVVGLCEITPDTDMAP
jgi:hypothetical protein